MSTPSKVQQKKKSRVSNKTPLSAVKKYRNPLLIIVAIAVILGGYLFFRLSKASTLAPAGHGPDSHYMDTYNDFTDLDTGGKSLAGQQGSRMVSRMRITDNTPDVGLYYATDFYLGPESSNIDPATGAKQGDDAYGGLQSRPEGKIAVFSIWNATNAQASNQVPNSVASKFDNEGWGWHTHINYNWSTNRDYEIIIERSDCSSLYSCWWNGWVRDVATGAQTLIGRIEAPYSNIDLNRGQGYFHEIFTTNPDNCFYLPRSAVEFAPPVATDLTGKQHVATFNFYYQSLRCPAFVKNILNPGFASSAIGPSAGNTAVAHSVAPTGALKPITVNNPTPVPAPDCSRATYQRGSQSGCVSIIQQRLTNLGYKPDPMDGVYGENTEIAVKVFQNKSGMTVDGIVTPVVWQRLFDNNAARKQ